MDDQDQFRDKAAIGELIHRYAQAITTGDFDAWSECFTADGVFITDGRNRGTVERFDVQRDLGRFASLAQQIIDATPDRRAHVTAIQIDVHGSEATARCYAFSTATGEDERTFVNGAGEYVDQLVKLDGRWLFQERRFHQDGV